MIGLLKSLSEMMRGKPIAAGRIYLRPPHRRDFRSWARLRAESRDFLKPWEPTWSPDALSRKAYIRRLRAYALSTYSDAGYSLFILRRDDDALLGGVSLANIRRGAAQSCNLGYWVGAPHAGHGYMTEALSAVLPFIFDQLRLHRIDAACLPNNLASQAVLRKIGFREEGFAREMLRIDNQWRDHMLFSLLGTDPRMAPVPVADKPAGARAVAARLPAFANSVSATFKGPSS